jgi:hypothetical protein
MTQGYNTTLTRNVCKARSQKKDKRNFLDNFAELGRKRALKRLEVKKGRHHIPNPCTCKVTTPLATHSIKVTHSIF